MDLGFLLESVGKVLVVFAALLGGVAYSTLLERKLLGRIQVRCGPNRVGPFGLLQPIADGLKFFFKEDVTPGNADKPVFLMAPVIALVPAICIVAVIPFGDVVVVAGREMKMVLIDLNVGLLYIMGLSGVAAYGGMLGGWASNNKYGLLGAMRVGAQSISYELGMGFTLLRKSLMGSR